MDQYLKHIIKIHIENFENMAVPKVGICTCTIPITLESQTDFYPCSSPKFNFAQVHGENHKSASYLPPGKQKIPTLNT